jgi:DNA-binding LytR/AlgR family response regulator
MQETKHGMLVGEREHRRYVLEVRNIEFIESQGNYVKFRSEGSEYISRDSIKRLAIALASDGFVRIGRSRMVNIRFIACAQRIGRGVFAVKMLSGCVLRSGPRHRDVLLRVLPLTQGRLPNNEVLQPAPVTARGTS